MYITHIYVSYMSACVGPYVSRVPFFALLAWRFFSFFFFLFSFFSFWQTRTDRLLMVRKKRQGASVWCTMGGVQVPLLQSRWRLLGNGTWPHMFRLVKHRAFLCPLNSFPKGCGLQPHLPPPPQIFPNPNPELTTVNSECWNISSNNLEK